MTIKILRIDLLRHPQSNAIWSSIALAIGEKTAKAVLLRIRCNNSNEIKRPDILLGKEGLGGLVNKPPSFQMEKANT